MKQLFFELKTYSLYVSASLDVVAYVYIRRDLQVEIQVGLEFNGLSQTPLPK